MNHDQVVSRSDNILGNEELELYVNSTNCNAAKLWKVIELHVKELANSNHTTVSCSYLYSVWYIMFSQFLEDKNDVNHTANSKTKASSLNS